MNSYNAPVPANNIPMKQKPKFSVAITTSGYQKLIANTLRDPQRANRFIAAITSAVAVNPALQECDAGSILSGALLGESLNLSPSPQLGQYYLVPFDVKLKGPDGKTLWLLDDKGKHITDANGKWKAATEKKAQFVLGYKGYIQLAIRSGYYKKLNVLEIKEGELRSFDPLNEVIECMIITDWEKREAAPTIGYYAMFEYTNGFRKAIYWSKGQMLSHADTYSPAFSATAYESMMNGQIPDSEMWKYSSFWYKDFDGMAKKTMLRQLISKWGIMSTELQNAFENDSSFAGFDNNDNIVTETEETIVPQMLANDVSESLPAAPQEVFQSEPEELDMDSL